MAPKRKPAKPKEADPVTVKQCMEKIVSIWPTMSVKPGGAEIDNPESELAKLRDSCLLTASMAGVLWNCKRGMSKSLFIKVARKEAPKPEFSDFTRALMAKGVEMEPVITSHFSHCMIAEYGRLTVGIAGMECKVILPGPFTAEYGDIRTSATPDALLIFTWQGRNGYFMPIEVKFFASKVEMPTNLPQDYIAQVLMQMVHCKARMAMLLGAVRDADGQVIYRMWFIKASADAAMDYEMRLLQIHSEIIATAPPTKARHRNEGDVLESLVVHQTTDCCSAWDYIFANLGQLPVYSEGSLHFPGHS